MNPALENKIARATGPLFHPLYALYLFLNDPRSWGHLRKWVQSFKCQRPLLEDGVPWLPFRATAWLERNLNRQMKVFEYGSGGSTIFFARRVGFLFTIEHNKEWYDRVRQALQKRGIENCSYELYEPRPLDQKRQGSQNTPKEEIVLDEPGFGYAGMSFDGYVDAINKHPDQTFDLVLIDGHARIAGAQQALPKVRKGGYLMLDNSNHATVKPILSLMKPYKRTDFYGVAPGWPACRWRTSVWNLPRGFTA